MKRFHVHLSVPDLEAGIRFYAGLFKMPPTVSHDDYAKWMLDDPRVNFAISSRGAAPGLNHLGLQVESSEELATVRQQFEAADRNSTVAEPGAQCCYALSDKHWVQDPAGIPWEAFHSLDTIPVWGGGQEAGAATATATACCAPSTKAVSAKPVPLAVSACCAPAASTTAGKSCC